MGGSRQSSWAAFISHHGWQPLVIMGGSHQPSWMTFISHHGRQLSVILGGSHSSSQATAISRHGRQPLVIMGGSYQSSWATAISPRRFQWVGRPVRELHACARADRVSMCAVRELMHACMRTV